MKEIKRNQCTCSCSCTPVDEVETTVPSTINDGFITTREIFPENENLGTTSLAQVTTGTTDKILSTISSKITTHTIYSFNEEFNHSISDQLPSQSSKISPLPVSDSPDIPLTEATKLGIDRHETVQPTDIPSSQQYDTLETKNFGSQEFSSTKAISFITETASSTARQSREFAEDDNSTTESNDRETNTSLFVNETYTTINENNTNEPSSSTDSIISKSSPSVSIKSPNINDLVLWGLEALKITEESQQATTMDANTRSDEIAFGDDDELKSSTFAAIDSIPTTETQIDEATAANDKETETKQNKNPALSTTNSIFTTSPRLKDEGSFKVEIALDEEQTKFQKFNDKIKHIHEAWLKALEELRRRIEIQHNLGNLTVFAGKSQKIENRSDEDESHADLFENSENFSTMPNSLSSSHKISDSFNAYSQDSVDSLENIKTTTTSSTVPFIHTAFSSESRNSETIVFPSSTVSTHTLTVVEQAFSTSKTMADETPKYETADSFTISDNNMVATSSTIDNIDVFPSAGETGTLQINMTVKPGVNWNTPNVHNTKFIKIGLEEVTNLTDGNIDKSNMHDESTGVTDPKSSSNSHFRKQYTNLPEAEDDAKNDTSGISKMPSIKNSQDEAEKSISLPEIEFLVDNPFESSEPTSQEKPLEYFPALAVTPEK